LFEIFNSGGVILAYRAVLFDFDGVVAETLPYHVCAWQQVFSKFQVKIEYEDIALQEGQGAHLIVGALAKQKGLKLSRAELDALMAEKKEIYNQITRARINPETGALISQLKNNNVPLALVTGAVMENLIPVTGEAFLKLFDAIITGDATPKNKPHPDPYLLAAKKLDVAPADCIVIENAPLGIRAARSAGMFCIALKTTIQNEALLAEADLIVESIARIPSRLLPVEK